jgi:dienelactone hydrolase
MLRFFLALPFLLVGLTAARAETVEFRSVAVGNSPAAPRPVTAWVYRPSGKEPAPAVIYAHTCGGLDDFSELWARRLASWGYFVIAPDSYGARGIRNACLGGAPANNLVSDVAGALEFLDGRPEVSKGRVALLGNSAGGKLAIRSVQEKFGLARRGLKGAIALYPAPCSPGEDRFVSLPLLALMAEKDDWTPIKQCHEWVEETRKDLLQAVFYPAHHGFDNSIVVNSSPPCRGGTCHLEYDAAVSADAEARAKSFLQSIFNR